MTLDGIKVAMKTPESIIIAFLLPGHLKVSCLGLFLVFLLKVQQPQIQAVSQLAVDSDFDPVR